MENHNSITEPSMESGLKYDPESWTRVFSLQWYKHQMSGWSTLSYWLLSVGIIFQVIIGSQHGINGLAITSTIAGIIGFTTTISITNGKAINGILGFISAAMLIYVASVTGNYSDIIMQGAYIVLLDIPILFNKQWGADFEPRKLNFKYALQTLGVFILFLAMTLTLDLFILHSPQAYLDAISATIGLTGAVLTVRRFRFSYVLWTAQGLFSVALWIQTAINGNPVWVLMFTYILYLCNDMLSFFDKNIKWFHPDKK